MSTEDDVRKASKQFYAALNRMANGDAGTMAEIWARDAAVTAMHPIGGCHVGWDAIKGSFDQFAQLASGGTIELKEQRIRVADDMACEVGTEHGQLKLAGQQVTFEHRVTNVYQRTAGAWKMIHHHTDLSPALLDVLKRVQPQPGR